MEIRIHTADASNFDEIINLNAGVVQHTSPMDTERLRHLDSLSSYHVVAEAEKRVVGFLLAMREGCSYQNANYAWFADRFPIFLYVDRVVVDPGFGGLRIGTRLYEALFTFARCNEIPVITCEFNIVPPNEPSRAFHRRFGFRELGTQWLDNRTKEVSLQVAETARLAATDK